jgi:cytochrome c biogenesis protein CcmG/thiol:disulfide interchange protein DsbE
MGAADAPPPLAALADQSNRLLDGGVDAYRARLRELRGYPVVVNKWASWCPPCRAEFPFFQKQALERGDKVAFLGLNSQDNDGDANAFLEEFPVPYPSFRDPDLKVAAELEGAVAFPTTAFYDSKGEIAYVHQGGYASEEKLVEDLERYAR